MGVTKVLMASNDTLFNFEDTLGDREDMLSPRNLANSGSNTLTPTPQIDNCKTPTNETLLQVYSVDYKPSGSAGDNYVQSETRPNALSLNLENLTSNLNDMLSPEQQKTFSEEAITTEQFSSDLSATIDATNTLDDLKTCISVYLHDDVNNSDFENSGFDAIATNNSMANGPIENADNTNNLQMNPIQNHETPNNPEEYMAEDNSMKNTKPSNPELIENECTKENKSPNLNFPRYVGSSEESCDFGKTVQVSPEYESYTQNDLNISHESGQLSGEEDPWVSQCDIICGDFV